jgi:N-acetylglucosamine-6-phosphate deacetylase
MATAVPARLLGIAEKGRIVSGGVADLALFDSDLQLVATLMGGRAVWERGNLFDRASAARVTFPAT